MANVKHIEDIEPRVQLYFDVSCPKGYGPQGRLAWGFMLPVSGKEISSMDEQTKSAKKKFYKRWWFWVLAVIAFFIIVGTTSGGKSPATKQNSNTQEKATDVLDTTGSVPYEIASKQDNSIKAFTGKLSDNTLEQIQQAPINKRFLYRVVVAPGLTQQQVKATINQLIVDETAKDRDLDEIGILMYDDKKDADDIYTVAKADWAPQGKWGNTTPQIASSNDRSSYQVTYDFAK
jgi:hypothetical protein